MSSSICDEVEWDVSIDGVPVEPRKFSNGKTQKDVVCEIVSAWASGKKSVVLESAPGSGKTPVIISAVMNHRALYGSDSDVGLAVVPTIPLAHQWGSYDFEDGRNRVSRARIKVLLGKGNFKCLLKPDLKADNDSLPCNKPGSYADKLRACPYFARPMPKHLFEKLSTFFDMEEVGEYVNAKGQKMVVYRRSRGVCPYHKQYIDMLKADIVVVTDAKFRLDHETGLLPGATYKVFDEADEYFFKKIPKFVFKADEIRAVRSLIREYEPRDEEEEELKIKLVREFTALLNAFKRIRSEEEFHDFLYELKNVLNAACALEGVCDDETVASLMSRIDEATSVLTQHSSGLHFSRLGLGEVVATALDTKAFLHAHLRMYVGRDNYALYASGTFPDREKMSSLFLDVDAWVSGEVKLPGVVYIPPKNVFGSFSIDVSGRRLRNDPQHMDEVVNAFFRVLVFMRSIVSPRLIYVHSKYFIEAFMKRFQNMNIVFDKHGTDDYLAKLRDGALEEVASTRAGRGIDLPNVHGIIFTKAPYPDLGDPFWVVLFRERPRLAETLYRLITMWNTYQILARALRNEGAWAVVDSPDNRVLDIIQEYAMHGKIDLKPLSEYLAKEKPKAIIKVGDKLILKELARLHNMQGEELELTPELLQQLIAKANSTLKNTE